MSVRLLNQAKRTADEVKERDGKRFKSNFVHIVTVLVGPSEVKFAVYEDLICNRSPFFKAACSKQWSQAPEKTVTLSTMRCYSFKVYLEWMYGEKDLLGLANTVAQWDAIFCKANPATYLSKLFEADAHVLTFLCDLWILGDYLGDITFTNAVVSNVHAAFSTIDTASSVHSYEAVRKIFAETPKDCTLQRYIVDHAADTFDGSSADHLNNCGTPFKSALLKVLLDKKGTGKCGKGKKFDICKYHVHGDGIEECD